MTEVLFDRRAVLTAAGLGAAWAGLGRPAFAHGGGGPAYGEVVAEAPFARIEKLADGVWAVVSTPLKDGAFNPAAAATVCNGGLVAGEDRVVAIDGFLQPAGAAWLSEQAMALTGRAPTDVVVTHFHADHTGGLAGYQRGAEGPEILATDTTRRLIFERYAGAASQIEDAPFAAPAIRPVLPTRILADDAETATLDVGGRTLTLKAMSGHTPSDLAIEVDDAPVVFAGDLVWAGLFHNYVDAIPTRLRASAGALLSDPNRIVATGHGHVAKAAALQPYLDLLDHVEAAARAAYEAGQSPAEGAAAYAVPESLGEWTLFNPNYYETAFEAWRRELAGETG